MRLAIAILTLAVLYGIGLSACSDKTYDVTVSWNIAGEKTCAFTLGTGENLVMEKMRVTTFKTKTDANPIDGPTEVACTNYEYKIQHLDKGSYFVKIEGMVDYKGETLAFFEGSGPINAPPSKENPDGYAFSLSKNKGEILVKWGFADYSQCPANGVEKIQISMLSNQTFDCALGQYLVDDLDGLTYTLSVKGLDVDGKVTWSGDYTDNPIEIKPGKHVETLVILDKL